jgi:hypothetical protein
MILIKLILKETTITRDNEDNDNDTNDIVTNDTNNERDGHDKG